MDRTAKPLLILPPAPARRAALEDLLLDLRPAARAEACLRLAEPPAGSRDAIAIVPDGGRALAAACIARRLDVGLLTFVFTRGELRRRGHARRLLQTLLSWFDTTGGRWLFATAPRALIPPMFEPFGFRVLHAGAAMYGQNATAIPGTSHAGVASASPSRSSSTASGDPYPQGPTASLVRTLGAVGDEPFLPLPRDQRVDAISRADWPLLFGLMQYVPGPDPRVPLAESAPAAEQASLDLLDQQDRGLCVLRGVWCHSRLLAAATLATDQLGARSFGALIPPAAPPALREDIVSVAASRGYTHVDFPFEVLAG